ncbi:hypothetical protein HYX02_00180 [Candidatus Woesearchaeota archaeon]|nr:hypothetical protein [Candidatus Woesearchaeota archaeon]
MEGIKVGEPAIYQPHLDIYSGMVLYDGQVGEVRLVEIIPTDKRRKGYIERIVNGNVAPIPLEVLKGELSIDDFLSEVLEIFGYSGSKLGKQLRNVVENYQRIPPDELKVLLQRFGIEGRVTS